MVRALTFLGVSIPSFWIGLILLRVFGVNLRWVSVSGGSTDFKSMIMPAITLAISMSAKYTRQVRIAVLDELRKDYVTGARTLGILKRYVVPNMITTLIVTAATDIGTMMLELAGLSFLGFGATAPTPEWGLMLNEGRTYFGP